MSHSIYLPDNVTNEMIDEALGADIPDEHCNCEHCEYFDSAWCVCKKACENANIPTVGKAMDEALSKLSDEEFAEFERDYDNYCDSFEFDPDTVDDGYPEDE